MAVDACPVGSTAQHVVGSSGVAIGRAKTGGAPPAGACRPARRAGGRRCQVPYFRGASVDNQGREGRYGCRSHRAACSLSGDVEGDIQTFESFACISFDRYVWIFLPFCIFCILFFFQLFLLYIFLWYIVMEYMVIFCTSLINRRTVDCYLFVHVFAVVDRRCWYSPDRTVLPSAWIFLLDDICMYRSLSFLLNGDLVQDGRPGRWRGMNGDVDVTMCTFLTTFLLLFYFYLWAEHPW